MDGINHAFKMAQHKDAAAYRPSSAAKRDATKLALSWLAHGAAGHGPTALVSPFVSKDGARF